MTSRTGWIPPSFSPSSHLFYVAAWDRVGRFGAGGRGPPHGPGYGAVRAIDPKTGEMKWEFRRNDAEFTSGVLTTASGLLCTGTWGDTYSGPEAARLAAGYLYALDARNGQLLWQMSLAKSIWSGPISYSAGGKQYIAVSAGNTLFALGLRQ